MNALFYLLIALTTLAAPASDISSGAFKGVEMTWTIASNAAIAVLNERVAQKESEESVDEVVDESVAEVIDAEEVYEDPRGYTDADVAYWNGLAWEYGFQPFNGFGDFNQFVESAQDMVYKAQTYGDPYFGYENHGLQTFYEDDHGHLIENPTYENRWGPEDDPTNQVETNDSW